MKMKNKIKKQTHYLINPDFFMLVSLVRSFDSYHVSNKFIHLIGSAFYTNKLNLDLLYKNTNQKILVLYIFDKKISNRVSDAGIRYRGDVGLIHLDLYDLCARLNRYSGLVNDKISTNNGSIIENLVGGFESSPNIPDTSNVLFIFENINWFVLQSLLLNNTRIKLSGGSISKKYLLSSVQYNLSKFLHKFDYSNSDIYDSFVYTKSQTNVVLSDYDIEKPYLELIIRNYMEEYVSDLKEKIAKLEEEKLKKFQELSSVNGQLVSIQKSKPNSIKIPSLMASIDSLKNQVSDIDIFILKTKEHLEEVYNDITNLSTLNFDLLKDFYMKNVHGPRISKISQNIQKELEIKFNYRNNLMLKPEKRYYSTFSYNSSSTYKALRKLDLNYLPKVDKKLYSQNLSISDNSNPIVKELLKILYSVEGKKNKQIMIEKFLILEQNNKLLEGMSSNQNLNYRLLNSNIVNELINYRILLGKLYSNLIKNLVNMHQSSENFTNLTILSKVLIKVRHVINN